MNQEIKNKLRVATVWLGGCSGCHMSFLDLDERLIELADKIQIVYSPIADVKEFPADVDVTLVEGAVTNVENEEMAHIVRTHSKYVVSFGDCATTGNVTAMRNRFPNEELLDRAYKELADICYSIPNDNTLIAQLCQQAIPLHHLIRVDAFLHGCPPTPDEIWFAINELLEGRIPIFKTQFLRYG
ncbi:MAG: oxidoreductase [Ignavibacteriales bacterium]|nr:oxidoreductase [Ignavibacteriales bacterium]